jgi:hypothetical protein
VAHAKGYNDAMIAEITRRFGNGVVIAAEQEGVKWQEEYEAAERIGRSDAEKDLRADHLAMEVFASRSEEGPDYGKILREHTKSS